MRKSLLLGIASVLISGVGTAIAQIAADKELKELVEEKNAETPVEEPEEQKDSEAETVEE